LNRHVLGAAELSGEAFAAIRRWDAFQLNGCRHKSLPQVEQIAGDLVSVGEKISRARASSK
jgi:hypothetical protein